jgi:hypothetical protein
MNPPDVLVTGWEPLLGNRQSGVEAWEQAVVDEIEKTPADSDSWPDSVHDGLAAAGKEMCRLGEERLRLTNDFARWLVETLQIDESRFTGMTYIRGAHASFDQMGWQGLRALLHRNRRVCGFDATRNEPLLQKRYEEVSAKLVLNRNRFAALDAGIDRIVWQLAGLGPDGCMTS